MSLTVNLVRLRYRLWRLDQAEKMTAERAGHIVAAGSIASLAIVTALLHLSTPQYVAGLALYAVGLLSGIRTGIEAARDFDRKEDQ